MRLPGTVTVDPSTTHDRFQVAFIPRPGMTLSSEPRDVVLTVMVIEVGLATVLVPAVQFGNNPSASTPSVALQPVTGWAVAAKAEPPLPATPPTASRPTATAEAAAFLNIRIQSPFLFHCNACEGFPGRQYQTRTAIIR